jgi:putative transposase
MARLPRIEFEGAVYHITSRGNARQDVFLDEGDREIFLSTLEEVVERYHWLCFAYCLMSNHYHLLIETPEGNLSRGMRHLNGVYTQKFNRSHGQAGHIFQGRFKSMVVQKETYLLELCRYIFLNPVRAGIVSSPEEWKWSSYSATIENSERPIFLYPDWILAQFGHSHDEAGKALREFVLAGLDRKPPWEDVKGGIFLGQENFMSDVKRSLQRKETVQEMGCLERSSVRLVLSSIFEGKLEKKLRDEKIFVAHVTYGYKLCEIADFLGIHYSSVSKAFKRAKAKRGEG